MTPGAPARSLVIRNTQRDCAVDTRHLRRVLRHLLELELEARHYDLAVHLVSSDTMAAANLRHLGHKGPTDVITFDYSGQPGVFHGELLICTAVARQQAKEFDTHWTAEIVRYAVHGLLHLLGDDDRTTALRRRMKREEDRLMRALGDALNLRLVQKRVART